MGDIKALSIVLMLFLSFSCAENEKKEPPIVHLVASPAAKTSSLPSLTSNNGAMLLSWVEKIGDSMAILKYAQLKNGEWGAPKEIDRSKDWFVNWADFPAIVENHGNLISHVLKKSSSETFSYDVKLNVLPKGNSTWTTGLQLHSDMTKTEHGFVTSLPYMQDSFFITWLDGRNTSGTGHGHHEGAMSIRAAEVSADGLVRNEHLLDERTCDCCQTTAAITGNGPIVIYRDRSEEEVRDMSIVRRVHGEWTKPKPVFSDNWKINGCPVNGPKAAAIGNNVVVGWYTGANEVSKVKVAFSSDGGENFDIPIRIGDSTVMGRVDIVMIDSENAIVSWMETIEKEAQIKAVKVHRSGKVFTPVVINRLDASRKTGFPQMELVGNKVYFAWTDVTNGIETVKTAYVRLDRFS